MLAASATVNRSKKVVVSSHKSSSLKKSVSSAPLKRIFGGFIVSGIPNESGYSDLKCARHSRHTDKIGGMGATPRKSLLSWLQTQFSL